MLNYQRVAFVMMFGLLPPHMNHQMYGARPVSSSKCSQKHRRNPHDSSSSLLQSLSTPNFFEISPHSPSPCSPIFPHLHTMLHGVHNPSGHQRTHRQHPSGLDASWNSWWFQTNFGKSPCSMGKSTMSMVIFNSYTIRKWFSTVFRIHSGRGNGDSWMVIHDGIHWEWFLI